MFQPAIEALQRQEQEFHSFGLAVPELPGGYYHDFTCPEHGVQLVFRADSSSAHRCPKDGRVFAGEACDGAWRWFVNHHLSEAALALSVLHIIQGGNRLEVVRSILLGYAEQYARYAETPRAGENPGIATYTTLDESVWVVPLAWAYSLVSGELSAEDRSQITDKLFIPAAEHLVRRHYSAIHNFTCWHNAAIATLGRVSRRDDLLQFAIDGPAGQRAQLQQGMLPDGLWYEGSMSYHFYSLWAILLSAIAARHDAVLDVRGEPAIARALRAPIDCAYSQGGLPATNDCWFFTSLLKESCHGVPPSRAFYEIGLGLYGDPAFAGVLQMTYASDPRDSLYALLFGPDEILDPVPSSRRSVVLSQSGLAFLRPSQHLEVMVKYGPHGGYHGHPDKLSLTGAFDGWVFAPDLGTPGYGAGSLETWYRQTLSHNTVLVDGLSQPPAEGLLRKVSLEQIPHFVDTSVGWSDGDYAGVSMRRIVLACEEYFTDLFFVSADRPRRFDLLFHCAGTASASGPTEPATPGDTDPHGHLMNVLRVGASCVRWAHRDGSVAMWLQPSEDEEIFIGQSPANPPSTCHGFMLRRRFGTEGVFLSVVHPSSTASVLDVVWNDSRQFRVSLQGRIDEWDLSALPDGAPVYRAWYDKTV